MTVVVMIKNDCNAALGNTKAPTGDVRSGPWSLHRRRLACDEGANDSSDDACAEFHPTVVIVVAVIARVAVVTVARGHGARRGHVVCRTDLVVMVHRSLRLVLVVDRRRLVGLNGLAGFVAHRLDHRRLALGRGTVPMLRRRHRAAAERHARQTRNHHLLDHLLHNAPFLSVA